LTNGDKINTGTPGNPHILIAPLDWGLGHATRCIPIIRELIHQGCRVTVASTGPHLALIKREFPSVAHVEIPGYGLRYSRTTRGLPWKIFLQIPKILISIKRENRWLANFLAHTQVDAIISDCRFGLHSKHVHSVLITHQLNILSPFGRLSTQLLRKWNYKFINRFHQCWIPDYQHSPGLAGILSHPHHLPATPVDYIGCISRMDGANAIPEKKFDVVVILSGPEPQRTIFENIILQQLATFKGKAAVVRGLPAGNDQAMPSANAIVYDHLPAEELCELVNAGELVISRSGYTTVMDLVKLQKKSVLVPTPGQTEQEYLADHLSQSGICVSMKQEEFDIGKAVQLAQRYSYTIGKVDMELYKEKVKDLLLKLPRTGDSRSAETTKFIG